MLLHQKTCYIRQVNSFFFKLGRSLPESPYDSPPPPPPPPPPMPLPGTFGKENVPLPGSVLGVQQGNFSLV